MTEQEIFDAVVRHLKKQGRRALNKDQCVYRGSNGLKCAVGCLISDAEYTPSMEGHTVDAITLPERLRVHRRLLCHLQEDHDRALDLDDCLNSMRATAVQYKINPAVLDEVLHAD